MKKNKFLFCIGLLLTVATIVNAQSVTWISSTEGNVWQKSKVKLQSKSEQNPVLQVDGTENGVAFKNWGTTFNELCWDALGLLTRTEQDEILYNIFSPQGDLRITRGRISILIVINRLLFLSYVLHKNIIRILHFGYHLGVLQAG